MAQIDSLRSEGGTSALSSPAPGTRTPGSGFDTSAFATASPSESQVTTPHAAAPGSAHRLEPGQLNASLAASYRSDGSALSAAASGAGEAAAPFWFLTLCLPVWFQLADRTTQRLQKGAQVNKSSATCRSAWSVLSR